METAKTVKWSTLAFTQFQKIYYFLLGENQRYAEKVRLEVLEKINQVALYLGHFSIEKYKTDNDGSYRYFELRHIRISYKVTATEVWIVRVRHTKMKPENF